MSIILFFAINYFLNKFLIILIIAKHFSATPHVSPDSWTRGRLTNLANQVALMKTERTNVRVYAYAYMYVYVRVYRLLLFVATFN